jgi:hypothetical protein
MPALQAAMQVAVRTPYSAAPIPILQRFNFTLAAPLAFSFRITRMTPLRLGFPAKHSTMNSGESPHQRPLKDSPLGVTYQKRSAVGSGAEAASVGSMFPLPKKH